MKRLFIFFLVIISLCLSNISQAAYPTTTEHHKLYPYTSIMASPYSGDPTGVIDCAAAIESIKANQSNLGTIYIPAGTFRIGTNLTIPAGMTLNFAAAAYFSIDAGIILTLPGPIVAPDGQNCFIGSGVLSLGTTFPVTSTTKILQPGTWVVTTNTAIPANIVLRPRKGAILAISTGVTLTINGELESNPYQIFSCTGTGKVLFAAGAVKAYHPEWWATNTTPGTTDMSTAILAAYTAAKDAGRGKVKLLANKYAVADLIFPSNAPNWPTGILIEGSGPGTKIVPAAAHTAGNFLMTFQGVGEIAGVGQSGTGWITLADFYIDGGSADLKGILIQPSNNFRLRDITLLNILGTALEAERPYDLYCTRVRVYGCGSFADNEAAVRMIANPIGTTSALSWGNQVYWTDCNIEGYQYRGLELIGCSGFDARGGKVHGSLKTVTTSLGNVYIDGGGEIRFTDFNFAHPHRAPALYIKDDPTGPPAYYSQVALSQCTFSQCESYDAGYNLMVVHYAAKYNASQLAINGCTFNITTGGNLGTNGRLIYIDPASALWRVNIGANLYNTNTLATILEDGRASYLAPDAPTYVSTTSFTLPGNYTTGAGGIPAVLAGQSLSAVIAAGTVYSTVVSSVYAAPNTTVTITDAVLTDPITSVTFYDTLRHTGAIAPEVHALALTLGHDTTGGQAVTLANDILDIRNTASGVIAAATEGGAASDDMSRIVGGRIGSVMVLRVALQSKPVTVKHGTGNIWLTGKADCILDSNKEAIVLFNYDGSNWVQIGGTEGDLPVYADNATARAAGLITGNRYRTAVGAMMEVYTP